MPISEHESACENTGADGGQDNNDGISGRIMVKKEKHLCHAFGLIGFSLLKNINTLNIQLTLIYGISIPVLFVKNNP